MAENSGMYGRVQNPREELANMFSTARAMFNKYQQAMHYIDTLGGYAPIAKQPNLLADPGILGAIAPGEFEAPGYTSLMPGLSAETIRAGRSMQRFQPGMLEKFMKDMEAEKLAKLAARKAKMSNPNYFPMGEIKEVAPKVMEINPPLNYK